MKYRILTGHRQEYFYTISQHSVCFIAGNAGSGGLPKSDVLVFRLDGGRRVIMRPSGTEPKLKSYYEVRTELAAGESLASARQRGLAELGTLRDAHQALLSARSA